MTNPHRRDDRGGVGRSRPHDGPQSRVWISTNRRLTVPNHTTIINLVRHRWTASSVLPWGFSRSLVRSRRQDGRCGTTRFLLMVRRNTSPVHISHFESWVASPTRDGKYARGWALSTTAVYLATT